MKLKNLRIYQSVREIFFGSDKIKRTPVTYLSTLGLRFRPISTVFRFIFARAPDHLELKMANFGGGQVQATPNPGVPPAAPTTTGNVQGGSGSNVAPQAVQPAPIYQPPKPKMGA